MLLQPVRLFLVLWKEKIVMTSFSITFSNVLLTLLYLLPGFLLCKCRKVRPEHMSSVSAILLYICGPCMFLNALTALDASPTLSLRMLLFLAISFMAELLLLLLIYALCGKRRSEFRFRMLALASVSGNTGFFGLPIVSALFPGNPEAAAYSCMFCVSLNILAWTVGVFTLTGDRKYISFRAAFFNPTVISVLAGFVLYLLRAGNWVPSLVRDGIRTVGGMSTPLCLFILGIRLAAMDLKTLFTQPFVYAIAAGKLLIFPLFCYALVVFLPLPSVFKASMLILGATPCASILLNLAEMHNSGQNLAANCALLSTLLSMLTIPLLSLLL